MGIAFVLFGFFGDSVAGSAVITFLLESSFGFIDLFTWTIPASIALIYNRSFRVFGIVLSANVAAIFIGFLLGKQLLIRDNYHITTGLFASAIIFLAFLLLPWLKDFAEKEVGPLPLPGLDGQLRGLPWLESLTPREIEILALVLEGHSNKKTSGLLHISENTLKTHLKSIYAKLGISHKRELFGLIVSHNDDLAPPKSS
jgi:DNA-binding CsgD family transcriptional regulator